MKKDWKVIYPFEMKYRVSEKSQIRLWRGTKYEKIK